MSQVIKTELELFQRGERLTERYREKGISWWDYCGPILVNSYPTYFEQLPDLIKKINREKRNSKNYSSESVTIIPENNTPLNSTTSSYAHPPSYSRPPTPTHSPRTLSARNRAPSPSKLYELFGFSFSIKG